MGWSEGRELTSTTWGVVRSQRQLWVIVVRGAVLAGLVGLVVCIPGILLVTSDTTALVVLGWIVLVIAAFLAAVVWMFHAGALAYAADEALRSGTSPSAKDALRATAPRRGSLAGWAAITVAVGWLLAALRGNASGGGAMAIIRLLGAGALAAAWSLLTFFVVPVIVLEGASPAHAIKRSGHILRERWGTQIAGNIRIGGLVTLLVVLPAVALVVAGALIATTGNVAGEAGGGAILLIGVAVLAIALALLSAMRSVFGVALYRYADTGASVGPFSPTVLAGAVRPR
jgi:hypothetical protein